MTWHAGLLALIGWMDTYRSTLVGLGLPDDVIHISNVPVVKTPRGESVPMHGMDIARLVYIHRIRKQLAKAFRNLAESDLLQVLPPACLPDVLTVCCSFASREGKCVISLQDF